MTTKTCFVLGNAPSLKDLNLDFICMSDAFFVNGAFHFLGDRKVKYYMVSDLHAFERYPEKIMDVNAEQFFLRSHVYDKALEMGFDLSKATRIEFYPTEEIRKGNFQKVFGKPVYQGATVVLDAVQIAFQLGYTDVYVGGVDLDYSKGAYFYPGDPPEKSRQLKTVIVDHFKHADYVFKNEGRRLLKITESPKVPLKFKPLFGVNT